METESKLRQVGHVPFVCLNEPLVCENGSRTIPFIGQISPSVIFYRFYHGFTLVELLITLVVIGILAALGAPGLSTFIKNQRITSQANDFLADVNFAKSEAAKRGGAVVICAATAGGGTCAGAVSTYTNGRLIFVNTDNDVAFLYNSGAGDIILRERPALEGSTNTLVVLPPAVSPIVFNARGVVSQGGGNFNFALCDDRGDIFGREIQIATAGLARLLKSSDTGYSNGCP